MEKWYQAIERRRSVRNYKSGLNPQQLSNLQDFADKTVKAHDVRIAVGRSSKIFGGKLFSRIKGTDCFAAIISRNGKDQYVGYLGEIFVLECVSRGFGTCWLGSSYKPGIARDVIELEEGETIACVISIGIQGETPEYAKRKKMQRLTGLTIGEFSELPKWKRCALEAARRAPSAMNKQSWDFLTYAGKNGEEDIEGTLGVVSNDENFGYGWVDFGIAMLHIELGAFHCGYTGEWTVEAEEYEATFNAKNLRDIEDEAVFDGEEDYDREDEQGGSEEPDYVADFDLDEDYGTYDNFSAETNRYTDGDEYLDTSIINNSDGLDDILDLGNLFDTDSNE